MSRVRVLWVTGAGLAAVARAALLRRVLKFVHVFYLMCGHGGLPA